MTRSWPSLTVHQKAAVLAIFASESFDFGVVAVAVASGAGG